MHRIRTVWIVSAALVSGGLLSGCFVSPAGVTDTIPPAAPDFTGVSPASPASDANPHLSGHAEPGSTVQIFVNPTCSGAPIAIGTAAEFASPGIVVHITIQGSITFYANAIDAAGNISDCSTAGTTYVHDSEAPSFGGVTGTTSVSGSQVTISWNPASDAVTPADSISYDICVSDKPAGCNPFSTTATTPPGATMWNVGGLKPDTSYTFAVRARDEAGNTDANAVALSAKTKGWPGPAAIAAGGFHTCALAGDGTARCWGWNIQGQLGASDYPESTQPSGSDPSQLLDNVRSTTPVVVSGLSGAVALSAGAYHSCALLGNGTVSCWGGNGAGQLGDGSAGDFQSTPGLVGNLTGAIALASGGGHTCAIVADGSVRCWGWNPSGQLGDGSTHDKNVPTAATGVSGAVALSAGTWHTCALLADGTVSCWGENSQGQLGDGTTVSRPSPAAVKGVSRAIALVAGSQHTCALLLGGGLQCWGENAQGELGDGSTASRATPGAVAQMAGATWVTAGDAHTCAMLEGGSVRCFGRNDLGQLGDASQVSRGTPAPVQGISGAAAITAGGLPTGQGGGHSCALLGDGSALCWGRNDFGQLGDGTLENRLVPVRVVTVK
jgi:alpha-tubulin suppressor-like RCC1 family protein